MLSEFHKYDINLRKVTDNIVGISLNETTTIDDLADLIEIFALLKDKSLDIGNYLDSTRFDGIKYRGIPPDLSRKTDFMK